MRFRPSLFKRILEPSGEIQKRSKLGLKRIGKFPHDGADLEQLLIEGARKEFGTPNLIHKGTPDVVEGIFTAPGNVSRHSRTELTECLGKDSSVPVLIEGIVIELVAANCK